MFSDVNTQGLNSEAQGPYPEARPCPLVTLSRCGNLLAERGTARQAEPDENSSQRLTMVQFCQMT